jgi:hypothetical protein
LAAPGGQKVPAGHAVGAVAPPAAPPHANPPGHAVQSACAVPPVAGRKDPPAQGMGAGRVSYGQYRPGGHAKSVASPMPDALQYAPAGHGTQSAGDDAAGTGLYVNTGHSSRTPLAGQYPPGAHGMGTGVPSMHVYPGGHGPQSRTDVARSRAEKVPLVHGVGTTDPGGQ